MAGTVTAGVAKNLEIPTNKIDEKTYVEGFDRVTRKLIGTPDRVGRQNKVTDARLQLERIKLKNTLSEVVSVAKNEAIGETRENSAQNFLEPDEKFYSKDRSSNSSGDFIQNMYKHLSDQTVEKDH